MRKLLIMLMLGGGILLGQPKHHHGGHHPPHDKPPCHAPIDAPVHKYMLMVFGVGLIFYSSKMRQ